MGEGTVKLSVNGNVDLNDLRTAVDALVQLLDELAGHEAVTWDIRKLSGGSLDLECDGQADTDERQRCVVEAARTYDRIGKAASENSPLDDYPDEVVEQVAAITSLIRKGKATSVVMSANGRDWTIHTPIEPMETPPDAQAPIPLREFARTSIRGRVNSVNDLASSVYFTLEEAHTSRKFKCWAPMKWRDMIWDAGRAHKWITVEGEGNRTAKKGPTITQVTDIYVHDDSEPGDWREAIGCLG